MLNRVLISHMNKNRLKRMHSKKYLFLLIEFYSIKSNLDSRENVENVEQKREVFKVSVQEQKYQSFHLCFIQTLS
jgi:hypothetical protein